MSVELLKMPAVPMVLGALILIVMPQRLRASAFLCFPVLALVFLWTLPEGYSLTVTLGSYELILVQLDALSKIFATIFSLIAIVGGIYAFHLKDVGQQSSALVYAGSALGVTLCGDYFTLFIFWELMAISSTFLVWARRTDASLQAGMRYLLVHIFGGGLLMGGILWQVWETGSIVIMPLEQSWHPAGILILLGVAINVALPPLHAWLPDAYPQATVTGAVFMSALTTKSAVYVLMSIFPGWEVLIWWGVVMAIYGAVYALLANDIRRILAYSIISQIGYMVAAIGIGTEMALNGAAAHAFSHILYKSILFMGAGAVLYSTGKSKLTELGGLAGRMKAVFFLYMIGAFSISGFPLFNGFISKSMVVDAAGHAHLDAVMLFLLLASVGSFLHTGLKLPYFTWFGTAKSDIKVAPVPVNMVMAMAIGAFLCTLFGVYPDLLYRYLPYPVDYKPYTLYHLVESAQILIFAFIGFWLLRSKLEGVARTAVDTDVIYRKAAPVFEAVFVRLVGSGFDLAGRGVQGLSGYITDRFENPRRWMNPFSDPKADPATYTPKVSVVLVLILAVFVLIGFWGMM